eukprot:Gb_13182 [translate_table: standard]
MCLNLGGCELSVVEPRYPEPNATLVFDASLFPFQEDNESKEEEYVDTMGMNNEPEEDMEEEWSCFQYPYDLVMDGWSKSYDSGKIKGGKAMEWRSNKNAKGKDPLEERVYLQVPPERDKFRFPLLVGVG